MIVITLPICIAITLLTLLFVVWGIHWSTLCKALLILGVLALGSAAVAAGIVSGYRDALQGDPKAVDLIAKYTALGTLNLRAQAIGWPVLALGYLLYRKAFVKAAPAEAKA